MGEIEAFFEIRLVLQFPIGIIKINGGVLASILNIKRGEDSSRMLPRTETKTLIAIETGKYIGGRVKKLVMGSEFGKNRVRDGTHQTAIGEKKGRKRSRFRGIEREVKLKK